MSVVDSWYLGTLCALLHKHQFKYQISGKDTAREKYDFLSNYDSLQYMKAVLLKFPG